MFEDQTKLLQTHKERVVKLDVYNLREAVNQDLLLNHDVLCPFGCDLLSQSRMCRARRHIATVFATSGAA